ncbi:hypothetical protein Tco_0425876 [Tanacetum coccineum]
MHTMRVYGVAGIKRRRRDLYGDGVRNLATASGRVRLKEDLESSTWRRRDDLNHYEAEIEAMNLILISIPIDIYNSVDAYKTAQAMWKRVERLKRGTVQNKVERKTRFNNEFDQFVVEPGETLVSVYNHTYDDLFDYLHQYEKLVNAYRVKKLEKSHDPLTLVAHTGPSTRNPSPYYVSHPSSVVDYDDDYQGDAFQNNFEDPLTSVMMLRARAITQRFSNPRNNHLRTSSNTKNQAIMQADRVNIQSRNSEFIMAQRQVDVHQDELCPPNKRYALMDANKKIDLDIPFPKVEIIVVVQPVNIIEEEDESAENDYVLRRSVKGKHVEKSRNTPSRTPIRSPRIHSTLISSDTEKLQELTVTDLKPSSSTPLLSSPRPSSFIKPLYSLQPKIGRFKRYKSFFDQLKGRYEVMQESLPSMVDSRVKDVTKTTVPVYVAEGLILERQKMQAEVAQIVADAIQKERENL